VPEIGDLANSGVRRVKTLVLGTQVARMREVRRWITIGSGSRRTVGSAREIAYRGCCRPYAHLQT
jgi:hypothetical protein